MSKNIKDLICITFLVVIIMLVCIWGIEQYTIQNSEYPFKKLLSIKVTTFVCIGILIFFYFYNFIKSTSVIFLWGIVLAIPLIIFFTFKNPFYLPFGDYWYMNALVTKNKFYNTWLVDSTIKDIPSYISPLYFYILGKIGFFLNLESPDLLFFGGVAGIVAMPILVYATLKDKVTKTELLLCCIIIPAFFQYEIQMKPYQSIAALLSLIFYYNIIHNYDLKRNYKFYIKYSFLGLLLFLYYYYCFFYLAIAFFIHSLLKYYNNDFTFLKNISIKNFFLYALIGGFGFLTFILPHIISVARVGNSSTILYQSTQQVNFPPLDLLILFGFIEILRTLKKSSYSQNSLILLVSVGLINVINILTEYFLVFDLAVLKIAHLYYLIIIPFSIQFFYKLIKFEDWHSPLKKNVLTGLTLIFMLYGANYWIDFLNNITENKDIDTSHIQNAHKASENIDFTDKILFNTYFHSNVELGAYTPVFLFNHVNIDYASPASNYQKRVEFIEKFKAITTSVDFAEHIKNNGIQKIDYIGWDINNRFSVPNLYRMGESPVLTEFIVDESLIQSKHFQKVSEHPKIYKVIY